MIFLYGLRVFWGFVVQIDISSSQSLSFLLVGIMICFACIVVCVGVSAEQFHWDQSTNNIFSTIQTKRVNKGSMICVYGRGLVLFII